jgi:hypothetical protein
VLLLLLQLLMIIISSSNVIIITIIIIIQKETYCWLVITTISITTTPLTRPSFVVLLRA